MTDIALNTILARLDKLEADVNARFAKIEAKLDEKPSTDTVWRAAATLIALSIATIGGTVALLKATGVIP